MTHFKIATLFISSFFILQTSFTQSNSSGVIIYKSTLTASIRAGGGSASQQVNLMMELAVFGKNYKITATALPSPSSTIQFGDMKLYKYYDAATNATYSITPFRNEQYAVSNPITVTDIKETGKTKELLGYLSNEFICSYNGVPAKGWYTKQLPATISAEGNLGLAGMVMSLESERVKMEVEKIDWNASVKEADTKLPTGIKKMTRQEFETMRKN